jgi:hypothetical protein
MKVTLVYKSRTYKVTPNGERARLAAQCPLCGAEPCDVVGTGMTIGSDDRHYRASAVALCCDRPLGELRAYPDTLFGLEEDERVLHGRPRVY